MYRASPAFSDLRLSSYIPDIARRESAGVHHQGSAFPAAHRIAQPHAARFLDGLRSIFGRVDVTAGQVNNTHGAESRIFKQHREQARGWSQFDLDTVSRHQSKLADR